MLPICVLLSILLSLNGCTKRQTNQKASLHVYTWSNYFNPDLITQFEKEAGVKVEFSYFSSNEELVAKLQAGAKGYDVVVPSGYVIKAMKSLNLLAPLKGKDWPEMKELLGRFRAPQFDPDHDVSAPFAWGTTGLAVNKSRLKSEAKVDSWSWVFSHNELAGQIAMLDDPPDVVGTAMKYLGYPANESSPEAFLKVKELLKKQKPLLKAYTSEIQPPLINNEIAIAQAYSTDALQARAKNPSIEFVLPKEGGIVWVDNLAVAQSSESQELARTFIRFMLRKEIQALQGPYIMGYSVLANAPGIHPPEKDLTKYEFTSDSPELHEKILRLWTELKAE